MNHTMFSETLLETHRRDHYKKSYCRSHTNQRHCQVYKSLPRRAFVL